MFEPGNVSSGSILLRQNIRPGLDSLQGRVNHITVGEVGGGPNAD